jgi:hypothetical protein
MKGKLNKLDNGYVLLVDNIMYATDNDKLSKQNCDEIFGVVDVEKLAESEFENSGWTQSYPEHMKEDFIEIYNGGFNKAMELNKNKMFTEFNMRICFYEGKWGDKFTTFEPFIQYFQQPAEIEVEIVTEPMNLDEIREQGKGFLNTNTDKPKFDSNGNLILKKP